jgi:hypothetical protein
MTDEPDLSMLLPTTAEFLRLRANDYAMALLRYDPDHPKRRDPMFGQDVHNLIHSVRDPHGNPVMEEMNTAYMLMRTLNTAAARLTDSGPRVSFKAW